uniref:putative nuclease HARBI1 n=1 Tax=Pristiophorus japonicus TaxID=55135 RepID=UPI00398E3663
MSEEQCDSRQRFQKEVLTEICHLLQPDLQPDISTRTAMPIAVKATVVLTFYASGFFQAASGDICPVSHFAAHRCSSDMTQALYRWRMEFIVFPMNRDKQDEWICGFARIAGIPIVQGPIDCTHVALRAPFQNAEVFRNKKGYHSLIMQLLCDHTQCILAVYSRYPGSAHDTFIQHVSNVPQMFVPSREGCGWLLGDKGYILATWLITPLRNTTTEQCYNDSNVATCNIIEQTIGVLKQGLRCLDISGRSLQHCLQLRYSLWCAACCTTWP